MKHRKSSKQGFTLVEIMIVVAIIGLLAAIAIPNFVRARTQSQKNACINNLRQIDGATQQYALDNKLATSASVSFAQISGYLKNSTICPAGGTTFANSYTVGSITNKPNCITTSGGSANGHVLPVDTSN